MSNITYDKTLHNFLQGKRIIAAGATGPGLPSMQRPPNPAFDDDDTAVLEILSGLTNQEMEAVERFNRLVVDAGYGVQDYDTAVGYLEANHNDPLMAALDFAKCNPYWHTEALSDFERNI